MSETNLKPVKHESFSLEPRLEGQYLYVTFLGTGDLDAMESLSAFLPEVHVQAMQSAVEEVRFDFHGLQFMNSSCFKAFVTFIDHAKSSNVSYRIRFITSPRHHWQRRSLEALRRLAMGLVTIQPED